MSSNSETLGKNFVYTGSVFWTLILRLVTSAASVRVTDMMLTADSLSRLQLWPDSWYRILSCKFDSLLVTICRSQMMYVSMFISFAVTIFICIVSVR